MAELEVDGGITGKNFILPETFAYAKERVKKIEDKIAENETINKYRLFNNLLSSQPLAFNLFHPLMLIKEKYPSNLNSMIQYAFPDCGIDKVTEIRIEFVPKFIKNCRHDKSAMDAAIEFINSEGQKCIIAIEVKYTDKLGSNGASKDEEQSKFAKKCEVFIDEWRNSIKEKDNKLPQIYRNFLLTENYRDDNDWKDSFSIILEPEDHPSKEEEIEDLRKNLKPEFRYKIKKYSLEKFVADIKQDCPDEFQDWLNSFKDRYLNFFKIDYLLK